MSGFTSVLQKVGAAIVKAASVTSEIMGFPFVAEMLGTIPGKTVQLAATASGDLGSLAKIVTTAEAMFQATGTGSQKLAAATPLVQQTLLTWAQSNLPGHSSVKDPAKLAAASAQITGGFADFLNALGD